MGARPGELWFELSTVMPAVGMGFLLFSGYSILKPIRDTANAALADRFGEQAVAGTTTATLAGMALATVLAAGAITLLGWRRFFVGVQFLWLLGTLGFAGLFAADANALGSDHRAGWLLAAGFIVSVNVFNLLSLSFLWSRLSDLFAPEAAKRMYPSVGLGITLGAIAGSLFTAQYAKELSPAGLMFISAGLLLGSGLVGLWLARLPDAPRDQPPERPATSLDAALDGAAEGVAAVVRSPYLIGLCLYLFFYSTTGTVLWFEQQRIVRAAAQDPAIRTELFARIDFWTNVVTLTLQGLVAGRIITFLGTGNALMVTPITTALGIVVLWHAPQLAPLMFVQVGRRGLHFAIDRPARESLYTVLGRAERHKAKGFIDTFVYRLGDQAGSWTQAALGSVGAASVYVTVVICVIWAGLGLWMGEQMRRRERKTPPTP
jgi:AAA family ATP:ADP antiporter